MRVETREEWNLVGDVDSFCGHLYAYYVRCGWKAIVCKEITIYVRLISTVDTVGVAGAIFTQSIPLSRY